MLVQFAITLAIINVSILRKVILWDRPGSIVLGLLTVIKGKRDAMSEASKRLGDLGFPNTSGETRIFVVSTNDVYLGNPNLKKAGTPIQFTQEQIEEWIKCKKDPSTLR